jgi:ERCC4-type nuclease
VNGELSALTIIVTKPKGKLAILLAEMGIAIRPAQEDEGNIDRYILSKRVVIERRTGSSLLRGIMDKTLFTSAIYLREHYEIPILIVEGQVNYNRTAFNPQAVRGALSSMMLQYGINILSTPDTTETASLIALMARQEQIGIPEISTTPKRKAIDLPDMQRRIIEMLPGCGMTMARNLLQHFGSVKRLVNATEADLLQVRGIGEKKAVEMHKVLNAEYESVDTERDLEDAIEAAPYLLFPQPIALLARQHYICTEASDRHIVDLVFLDLVANELILVELKRDRLTCEHEEQLQRYLDRAHQSSLLNPYIERGIGVRGLLATATACEYKPRDANISVRIVDREQVIEVLKELRQVHV